MKRNLLLVLLVALLCLAGKSYADVVISQEASYTTAYACYDLAVSPDGNTLYAVETGTSTILTLNAKTLEKGSYLAKPGTKNEYGGCVAVDANGAIYGTYVVISGSTNVIIYKWANNSASATEFKNLGTASTYFIDGTYRSGYGMDVRVDANGNGFLLLPVPNNGTAAAGASVIYLPISNNVAGTPQHVVLSSTNWGSYPKVRIISDTQFWYDGNASRPYLVTIKKANDGTVSYVSSLLFPYKSDPAIFGAANGVSDFSFKGTRYAILGTNNHGTSSGYVCKNRANLYTISVGDAISATTKCYLPEGGMGTVSNSNGSVQSCVWNNGNEVWMYTSAMGAGNKIYAFRMHDDDDPTTLSDVLTSKTIRRSVYYNGSFYVLAVDGSKNPYLYKVNAETEVIEAVLPTDFCSVSANGFYKLSDIAITDDGVLVGCNNEKCTTASTAGQHLKFYKWDLRNYTGEFWFSPEDVTSNGNPAAGNFGTASSGATMAYSGTMTNGTISWRAQTLGSENGRSRYGYATIVNGSPTVAKRSQDNTFMTKYDNVELTSAPTTGHFIFMSDTQAPTEYSLGTDVDVANEHCTFATAGVHGISFFSVSSTKYMVVPSASDVNIYDVTSGLASASLAETFTYNSSSANYRYAYGFKDGDDFGAYLLADDNIVELPVPITADGITLDKTSVDLPVGGTVTLTPTITPAEAAGNAVTWSSNNTTAATVAGGVVTANAIGVATITADVDGQTATCTIHVCAPVAHILPYNLNRTLDGSNYTFSFKSNIAATSGKIIFYQNGVKKGEVAISDPITAGANEVVVAKSALPQIAGVMTWAVELTGADSKVVGKFSDNADKYRFYHLRSIGINVYPETDGFGNIYVNMGLNGSSDGSCTRTKEQTKGIFQFDAALNLKNPTNSGYTGGISWPNSATAPFRIAIGEDGLLYASGDHASYAGVWVLDNPDASAGTFRSVISGHQEQGLYVSGTGSQRKLYTTENGSPASIMEYAIGNNVPYTGDGRVISTCADAKLIYGTTSNMNIATDGKGGLWIYEYRAEENSTYVCLTHLNSSGTRDYDSNSVGLGLTASQRGGFAVNAKKNLMACGTVSKVTIFSIAWNGSNVPILTKEHEIPINGSNIDCIAFDYADNLFVGTSATEYLFVYALPTAANKTEVPAKSTLTVEAFDHIDVSSVTINEGAQSIERGNTFTYTATVLPANASDPSLTWASDDEDVAIVNETTGEVTAVEVGTAHITATADGVTSSAVTVTVYKLDFDVTWVPNGATVKTTAPATNNALWQQFMTDYNAYYSMSRGAQSLTLAGVRSFLNNTHCIDFMTSSASPWKWLGDYILPVATAAGRTLDTEMKWSFDIAAFFNALPSASGEYGYGDYTTAGQPAQWLPYWKVANNYLPATLRAEDALPILNKGNDHFDGWYDNSGFTGSPVTSVTADITLYAKWSSPLTLDETLSTNGATITANNGKVMNVLLNRRFSVDAGLYTLVLPFDLTDEQLQEAFGADYQLSVLHDAYMKTPELMYLKFDHVNNLIAGEPCLLQVSKDVNEDILFRDVTIDKTDRSIQFAGDHDIARMIGLYDQTDIPASAKDYYLGNNNYLFQYKSTTTTKGFRAYFHFPDFGAGAPPRARVVFHDDTTTDVEPVEATPATIEPQKVIRNGELIIIVNGVEYDVTGRVRVR